MNKDYFGIIKNRIGLIVIVSLLISTVGFAGSYRESISEKISQLFYGNGQESILTEAGQNTAKLADPGNAEGQNSEIISLESSNIIDGTTYPFAVSSGAALENMSTGTTMLLTPDVDDAASSIAPIGFDFWFDGVRQTFFSTNANGLMRLGSTQVTTAFTNDIASATNVPQIAPYWDDLWLGNNGKVHYKVLGSAPNRKLVVEWLNVQVPRVAAANTGSATYQAWLYETTGQIEFVYGNGIATNAANAGYSIGIGSSATQFASVTSSSSTVAYGTANNANTDAIVSGTKYSFTPVIPATPSGVPQTLTFTAIGLNTMTLNWNDNASNEFGYVIYRSLDGANFEFVRQLAADSTSSVESGIASNTNYFWRVFAVSEGGLSAVLTGNQATLTGTLSGNRTVGPTGNYASLTAAVADVAAQGLSGNLTLELQAAYTDAGETFPIVLNSIGSPGNLITIRPESGAAALSISSAAAQTLSLNGAAYVTVDGRAGGAGTSQLTVANTSSTGIPIQFINDAKNNTVRYLTVNGVNTSVTGGSIVFGTTTGSVGNSFNTIDNCDIKDGATTPTNGIYSLGTASAPNANNTVSNNLIHEYFSAGSVTNGVMLASAAGNVSNLRWTISNNRFFQTPTRTYTTGNIHSAISIGANTGAVTGGFGYTITGNTIGFASSAGTGTYTMAGTVATRFIGINLNGGSETSSIQNNTITAFSLATSSGATTTNGIFSGINVLQGNTNIGTVSGNTVGSTSQTGAITTTSSTTLGLVAGITVHTNLSNALVNVSNNSIGGFTANGSGSISGIVVSAGQPTITNNTIGSTTAALSMNSPTVAVASTLLNGINVSAGTGSVSPTVISGNTIANFSGSGTGTAAVARGIVNASVGPATVTSNIINNIAGASANTTVAGGGTAVQGILQTGSAVLGANISQNTINAISATNTGLVSTVAVGIGYSNPSNGTVTRNRIYDIRNASTGTTATAPPMAMGILIRAALGVSGGTFANNMISLGNAQTTNTQFVGMMNSFTTTAVNISYNSVSISGSAASGALPSHGFLRGDNSAGSAVTSPVDLKNNIFSNTRTGGTGKHYAIGNVNTVPATGWGASASNNNVLNNSVPATLGIWGLAADQTFSGWKSVSGGDGASLSGVSAPFVDAATGDLHLNFGVTPTAIESGGTTLSITTDFDNQVRPGPAGSTNGGATAPDIGADEFDGVPLDIVAPIIAYTPLVNTISTGNRVVSATISDVSGVATGGLAPRVYFNKNAGVYASTTCLLTGGTSTSGTWDCTIDNALIGGVVTTDVVRYFVVAQDTNGNLGANPGGGFSGIDVNNVTSPPTTPNQYTIIPQISGGFNVGTGETYTSLTNGGGIFETINNAQVSGNITINITSDLTGETGSVALNQFAGGFSLTIKPDGAARTITSSASAVSVIKLNDADNVTIDGSLSGGTDRSLTVINSNTAASTTGIWVASAANGAQNNVVKNLNLFGGTNQSVTNIFNFGVISSSSAAILSGAVDNDGNTYSNNYIRKVSVGVISIGSLTANMNQNTTISGNLIGPDSFGIDQIGTLGVLVFNENALNVSRNEIRFVGDAATSGGSSGRDHAGISLCTGSAAWSGSTAPTIIGNVTNANISRNLIHDVVERATFSAVGIVSNCPNTSPNMNTIANNMIYNILANGTAGDQGIGIGISNGNSETVAFNSIFMTGDIDPTGATSSSTSSFGISAAFATIANLTVKDNISVMDVNSNTGTLLHSAVNVHASLTWGTGGSDYNDFFAPSANTQSRVGTVGGSGGTFHASLAAWQTATSQDAASISADPLFISGTDLHIAAGSPALFAGNTVAGITVDFDGDARHSTPDIGADELARAGQVEFNSATYTSGESAGTSTVTVVRTGGSDGTVTVDYATSNGTATGGASCGAGVDYITNSGTLTFGNGVTSQTFDVTICNDTLDEPDETIDYTLSNPTGGTSIGTQGTAVQTITDDDAPPTMSINDVMQAEGNSGTSSFAFTVSLSQPSGKTITVDYQTADGTATTADNDYVGVSSTQLVFTPGQTSLPVAVTVNGDTAVEPDETFFVDLSSPVNATFGDNQGQGTIQNDDSTAGPVTVTATAGTTGPTDYLTVKDAFDAINAGTHQGSITVAIVSSTTETTSAVLNSSGAGSASYTSVLLRPSNDAVSISGPSIQGRGLIELNGADNVTINGDNPNTSGINRNLTIQNTAANTTTFTSVVRIALATTVVNSADNNAIQNLNVIGSASGQNISTATTTTGSHNTTFGIFAGPGGSTVSGTTAPAAVTSVLTSVGAGATGGNLFVNNNRITTVGRGISINGSATSVFPGLQITTNTIGNPTAGDPDQVYAIGITGQGSANGIISDNTVWVEGYTASSASTHGINVGVNSVNATFTIERNQVNRVKNNNGGTWSAFGINLGGGSNHVVQNNFVSGVINSQVAGTGGFGTTFGSYGIRISSGTGHKVYHNSVHLYGAMQGTVSTNLSAAFLISGTTLTGIDVRNNAFSNQISGGNPTGTRNVDVYLPSGATSALNLTLNNNGYYSGTDALSRMAQVGATFGAGEYLAANFDPTATTPATNFRAYSSTLNAAGTNDNASFATSSAPPFVSNADLHIPANTPTRLESGGAAVGVVSDIDLDARNATTPDIGADEFAGLPPFANDIAAAAFVTPVNGATIVAGQIFSPQATFNNNGTASQSNVTVRYQILDGLSTIIYNETGNISAIAPLQTVAVTFPATSLPIGGTYSIRATSELSGDEDTSNDLITGSVTVVPPISGSINVGAGETYTSLTNAGGLFQAINTSGISSNVTVNITSDLTAETGAVALNQIAESGAGGYTVTFKPSGAARTISGSSAASSGLIILHGADRIVFDGSLSGGNDRSLTITNNQATTGIVIWMRSPNSTNGATNNTVKNCIINGAPGPNSTTVGGILSGSSVTLGGDAEAPNSNNTIHNNWIYRVQNSLYLRGGLIAANFDQNWVVTNNEIGSSVANDNNIFRGMLVGNSQNFTISGNLVQGVRSTTTTTAAMSGIQLALLVNTGQVTNNVITNIKSASTTGTGAFGLQISSSSTASNVTIANNFITDVATTGLAAANSNGYGMMFNGSGTGYNVYFNSVNMNTNQGTGTISGAINVNTTFATAGALNIRNNVFSNSQTTGTRYAVYSTAAAGVFAAINNNDYFAQNVGFIGGSARATLGDWQTATGQDSNSLAVDPLFVSATDLHILGTSPMISAGVNGTGITTDIDGDTRDATPDIGADEIVIPPSPGSLQFSSATYSESEGAGPFTITVTRTGGSLGTVTIDYATSPGTATGGTSCTAGVDYINTSGTLTFLDGVTSRTFDVAICNDLIDEPDETINYSLSNPTGGATLGTPSTAVQTIVDDDPPAGGFSVSDVRVFEGNAGTVNAAFTVTYSGAGFGSVQYATSNGTAIAGIDYVAKSGTVTFNGAGFAGSLTQIVNITINGDLNKEANETFFVNLFNPVNSSILDNQGVGIIIDEDRAFISDFDNDKKSDYTVYRPGDNTWYIFQSSNNVPNITVFGLSTDIPVPGDYDGDGIADIAVFRPSEANWYVLQSSNSAVVVTQFGQNGDKPVQGDFDNDGKTDRATFRSSDSRWRILQSSNGITNTVQFGISTDIPMQGDYDGDAQTDIAVYRGGVWYILRSSDASLAVFSWGISSDKPVAGDFDGDGRNDVAIYRDGVWWISYTLTGTTAAVNWGLPTDIPTAADFDGDGTTDLVVYRPSEGNWYTLRSSDSSFNVIKWGLAGDIPIPAAYNVMP